MSDSTTTSQSLVLAIDDEPEILEILQQALALEGIHVLTATDPKQALAVYEQRSRDIGLVLLDYVMPEMTGDLVFECLQRVNPDVRVVLLTGCDDLIARKLFETGLRGFIQKPFYLDDLIQRVREELT